MNHRAIYVHQKAVEGILFLRQDFAAYEVAHQHRYNRDGQECRGRHGVGFRESQRFEEPAFLRLEREYRQEGERDNQ